MKPSAAHIPFSIPSQGTSRRDSSMSTASSISEASSSSLSDQKEMAYKDEVDNDQAAHTYPPKKHGKIGRTKGKTDGLSDEDGEDGEEELLDEEERVGLMMKDRNRPPRISDARWSPLSAKFSNKGNTLLQRLKPFIIAIGTALAILILIPLMSWLASSTNRMRTESVLKSGKHLTEVIMPSYWRVPEALHPSTGGIRKPKRPLPPGTTKLTSFGAPFSLETIVEPIPSTKKEADKKTVTIEEAVGQSFLPSINGVRWSAEDPDEGVFVYKEPFSGNLVVEDVTYRKKEITGQGEVAKGGGKVTFVKGVDVKDENGRQIDYHDFKVSPDMRFVLFFSEKKQQWRYSTFNKVWLYDVSQHSTQQIGQNLTEPNIATAEWSKRSYVSYVEGNNLYLIKDVHDVKNKISITDDGNKNIFNAVPDWVYEEEVFSGDTAHWWSPDGNRLVFLRFDEADVMTYSFPVYNPTEKNGKALLYPSTVDMKYPKPGTPNPKVSVHIYDAISDVKSSLEVPKAMAKSETDGSDAVTVDVAMGQAGDQVLVTEVKWLSDSILIVRETNRVSDVGRHIVYDSKNVKNNVGTKTGTIEGKVSRREMTSKTGGWITVDQDIQSLRDPGPGGSTEYVDIVAVPNGFRHIAYYRDAENAKPIFLTAGEWEVEKIVFVRNRRVYFSAAYPRPSVRHILYVDVPKNDDKISPEERPKSLTNIHGTAWYEIDFDPKGNYYQLTYRGPHVPWVKIFSLRDPKFELVWQENTGLQKIVSDYHQPQRLFYNITLPDKTIVSAQEFRPHDFDGSGSIRYPVLIKVYGGPNSQMVDAKWSMADWTTYLTCTLGYIVIILDGRGTGFRGRAYRDVVSWELGAFESHDVVKAAEAIRRLPYVAQSKVGIWGWSFGGYLTAKALERDSGTFDLGMSVAPVSRWEFYDTIYTERYMKTPHLNKEGYENSSVHINKGFQNSQFLLAQGSGDDNVHFQSSAQLLDQLTGKSIRGFWFRMFPDSAHSITKRGAYLELHQFLTRFLVYNWGAGGKRLFRYKDTKEMIE